DDLAKVNQSIDELKAQIQILIDAKFT
ncbi:unnamed protein product, partial [Adineta steineri]